MKKKSTWRCQVRRASTQVKLYLRREVWSLLGMIAVDHMWNHTMMYMNHSIFEITIIIIMHVYSLTSQSLPLNPFGARPEVL